MGKSGTGLKALLWLFCLANVILGAMGIFGGDIALKAAATFYGAHVDINPQLNYIIRMLGVFVFALGILGGVAAYAPVKNKAIINVIISLLVMRILQRVIFAKEIFEAFGISSGRNWLNIIFFSAIAIALFLLRPKTDKV